MMKNRYIISTLILLIMSQSSFAQDEGDLINITTLDSTIIVDIKYATADNFMGDTLYSANICLLRRNIAEMLIKVHRNLRKQGFGLKVWDGYRPLSVQKKMWERVPDSKYVANPKYGSMHNRGSAVDVTLVDSSGNEVEMPTGFDDFSEKAASEYFYISKNVLKNRKTLQYAMQAQGFTTIKSEWWHFNGRDAKKYPILDIPLEKFVIKNPRN